MTSARSDSSVREVRRGPWVVGWGAHSLPAVLVLRPGDCGGALVLLGDAADETLATRFADNWRTHAATVTTKRLKGRILRWLNARRAGCRSAPRAGP